jgi:hypothetical protein
MGLLISRKKNRTFVFILNEKSHNNLRSLRTPLILKKGPILIGCCNIFLPDHGQLLFKFTIFCGKILILVG